MTSLKRADRCPPSSDLRWLKLHRASSSTFTILQLLLLLHFQFCQSALLTNIYGKNLSEITDLSHRFLLLPSHSIATSSYAADEAAELETSPTTASNSTISRQQDEQQEPLPDPAALVSAPTPATNGAGKNGPWRQQQANKAKLILIQQNSSGNEAAAQSTRVPAGEPQVIESVSTEFPNPNINNLGHEITKILRKFFLHGYDKRVRPNYNGPPALVNVSFHIIGISSVDEVQMDFTTDFYFRQKWFDPRLEFDPVGNIDELCVGAEFAEKIWLPDTFFANEKTATFHKATTENTFIRIGTTGRVYRSIRLTVTCSCPMDLQYFPMDRQRCKIEIESYGYGTKDIDYRWERGDASVSLNTKIELPQFKILGFKMGQEYQNLSSGNYIRLYCEIHFVRSMGYYLFQIYIPASLIVMISWVSFWLHRNATPARVALGVTTVLTMTTLMSSTNAALPKISYIKSIDVFLGTCFVMVFAALLEYASVGYIGKRIAMKRKRLQDLHQMQQHHQKVCVAAAASAAAAAAASNHQGESTSLGATNRTAAKFTPTSSTGLLAGRGSNVFRFGAAASHQHASGAQTLSRSLNMVPTTGGASSRTLQRVSNVSGSNGLDQDYNDDPNYGQGSGSKIPTYTGQYQPQGSASNRFSVGNQNQLDQNKAPLMAAGAAIAAAAAANSAHGTTAEFEVNQAHDLVRICGLTPSAIDKHSRVVFPICFVCFNLMYWIIYGHISQQVEDKGPPLIPFIKT